MFEIYGEAGDIQDLSKFENFKFDVNESFFGPHAFISFDIRTQKGLQLTLRCDLIVPVRNDKSIGKGTLLATISSFIPGDETIRIATLGPVYKGKKAVNDPYVTHAPNVITYGVSSDYIKLEDLSIKLGPQRSFDSEELDHFVIEDLGYVQIKTQNENQDLIIIFSRQFLEETGVQYISSYYGIIKKGSINIFEKLGTILRPTRLESIQDILSKESRVWDTLGGEIRLEKKSDIDSDQKSHNVTLFYTTKEDIHAKVDNYIIHGKEDQVKIAFMYYNPYTNVFERSRYKIECLKDVENCTWAIDDLGIYHGAINRINQKSIQLIVHTPKFEALSAGLQVFLTYTSIQNVVLFTNIWRYHAPRHCDFKPSIEGSDDFIELGSNYVLLDDTKKEQFENIISEKDKYYQAKELLSLACQKLLHFEFEKIDNLISQFEELL